MSLSPATSRAVDDVVRHASAAPAPHVIPFQNGLLSRLGKNFEPITQADIAVMANGFRAACSLLMPSKTIDAYIADRCEAFDISLDLNRHQRLMVIPTWCEMYDVHFPFSAPTETRASSLAKFCHAEIMGIVEVMEQCPDLMVALGAFQQLVGEYLETVARQAKNTAPALQAHLRLLQEHWLQAGNFQKMLHAAFVHAKPEDIPVQGYFRQLDRTHLAAAFSFLRDSRSFDLVLPAEVTPGGKALVFSCPAQQLLQQLFVEQSAFLHVVEALRTCDVEAGRNFAAQQLTLQRHAAALLVAKNAGVIRSVVAPGNRMAYGRLERYDIMLQQYGPQNSG